MSALCLKKSIIWQHLTKAAARNSLTKQTLVNEYVGVFILGLNVDMVFCSVD